MGCLESSLEEGAGVILSFMLASRPRLEFVTLTLGFGVLDRIARAFTYA